VEAAGTPQESKELRRDILWRAYLSERRADAETLGSFVAILATSVGLLSIIGFALLHGKDTATVPGWVSAFLPAVPLPVLGFASLYSNVLILRGQYIGLYERELRRLDALDLQVEKWPIPVPSGQLAVSNLWRSTRGSIAMLVMFGSLTATYVAILVVSFKNAHRTEPAMAYASLIAGSLIVTTLFVIYAQGILWPKKLLLAMTRFQPDMDIRNWENTAGSDERR
jgi:hypothetical protein